MSDAVPRSEGVDGFIKSASSLIWADYLGDRSSSESVRHIGEMYANIRPSDFNSPYRFLSQMAGAPPVQFGNKGFRTDLTDDYNPARHYIAFVYLGFYLPGWLATLMLYLWEVAGFVRYRGEWSWPDVRSGQVGIRHGQVMRRYGAVVLPGLIAAELASR